MLSIFLESYRCKCGMFIARKLNDYYVGVILRARERI